MIGTGLAVLALVISALAYWQSKRSADANVKMAKTNEDMVTANRSMADSNKRMAGSNEEMVVLTRSMERSAEMSAQAAREAADHQTDAYRRSQAASFSFRLGGISTTAESEVEFQAIFDNEGPHAALEVVPRLGYQSNAYAIASGGTRRQRVDSGSSMTIRFRVPLAGWTPGEIRPFVHGLMYRNGNGQHDTVFLVNYSGDPHAGRWSASVVEKDDQVQDGGSG